MPELVTPLIRTGFLTLSVTENATLLKHHDRVELDAQNNNIIFRLPLIVTAFKKKPSTLYKRIDTNTSNTVRITGTNTNYEEDDGFTPLTQTVSKSGGFELTASADITSDLQIGDRIQVAGIDTFTIAAVLTNFIATNEAVVTAYSSATLSVGGYFLGESILLETQKIYASNANIWRSE